MTSFYGQCWVSDEYKRNAKGYMKVSGRPWRRGQGHRDNSPIGAHRVSFYLWYGWWPNVCRHTCDNPPCYNPTHLLDGTVADNNRDMWSRGRGGFGSGRKFGPGNQPTVLPLNLGMPATNTAEYSREMRARIRAGTWIRRDA